MFVRRSRAIRWLLILSAVVLLPAGAWATPVTYDLTSGTISLSLKYDGLAPQSIGSAALTSGSATFDPSGPGLTGFDFGSNTSITLPSWVSTLTGYHTLALNIALAPGSGYTSSSTGSNPYSIAGGPVGLSGSFAVIDGSLPTINGTLMTNISAYTGSASVSGNTLTLDATGTLAQWTLGSCDINGTTYYLLGSLNFVGVPEPGLGLLLLGGLGLVAAVRRRSTRAS